MQGGAFGNRVGRGPDMFSSGGQYSTVNTGSIYGPAAGQAVSDRASSTIGLGKHVPGMGILTVPLALAAGFLIWYALKSYD